MSLAFRRRYLLRQAEFRYAVLRIGHAAQKCKNPTETNPAGFSILATSYSRTAYRRTTIGAAAFHCRVRNGNGWGHCAIVTRVRCRTGGIAASHRERPMSISGDEVDLAARSLDFARDDKMFSKNKFRQFSDIYIQVFGKFRG